MRRRGLEREDRGVLARAEHIDEGLAHEQPDGDTDRDRNHRASNVDAVPLGGDTSRLGQTRLHRRHQRQVQAKRAHAAKKNDSQAQGTARR